MSISNPIDEERFQYFMRKPYKKGLWENETVKGRMIRNCDCHGILATADSISGIILCPHCHTPGIHPDQQLRPKCPLCRFRYGHSRFCLQVQAQQFRLFDEELYNETE